LLETLLEEEDIRHDTVRIKNWTRESYTIYEESTGQQFRFSEPGPEMIKNEYGELYDKLSGWESPPEYLIISGGLPPGVPKEFYKRLTRFACEKGVKVILDTSGEALTRALEEKLFLIKPNIRELSVLAGYEIENETEQERIAGEIVASGKSKIVVLSLGAAGALLLTNEKTVRLRAPTVNIRSKVGAGDSMVGGIVLALSRNYPLKRAVQFGVAAGAAAVMTPGTELCRREDTESLFEKVISEEGRN
jgi:6-phosphofructokinase 2